MALEERVVLITGATGVIGSALTDAFAAEGARLALGVQRIEEVDRVDRALRARGLNPCVAACDLRYEEDVVRMIHRVVRQLGRIDVLVNAAWEHGPDEPLVDYPVDPWRKALATNVTGAYLLSREVLPWMIRQRGGCIVYMVPCPSLRGRRGGGSGEVCRYALEGLTKQFESQIKTSAIRFHREVVRDLSTVEAPVAAPEWAANVVQFATRAMCDAGINRAHS